MATREGKIVKKITDAVEAELSDNDIEKIRGKVKIFIKAIQDLSFNSKCNRGNNRERT